VEGTGDGVNMPGLEEEGVEVDDQAGRRELGEIALGVKLDKAWTRGVDRQRGTGAQVGESQLECPGDDDRAAIGAVPEGGDLAVDIEMDVDVEGANAAQLEVVEPPGARGRAGPLTRSTQQAACRMRQ
jgi:hypothetical protein